MLSPAEVPKALTRLKRPAQVMIAEKWILGMSAMVALRFPKVESSGSLVADRHEA